MAIDSLGRVALVTGAAAGLGRAVALALAARGARVVAADIDAAGADAAARDCAAAGGQGTPVPVDLAAPAGPADMVAAALAAAGRIDVLVNNAGYATVERFLDMTADGWDRTYAVNIRAVALATAAAGRHMAGRGSGRIVNITSPASRMALPNYTAYAASKAAVDSITRAAAIALAPSGVQVNSVAPGMMDTELQYRTERLMADIEGRNDIDAYLAERTARIPLGRRTTPEEVASVVAWLALDAPAYITAERFNASGGLDKD